MTTTETKTSITPARSAREIIAKDCHPAYKFADLAKRCTQLRGYESDPTVAELLTMVEFLLQQTTPRS